MDSTLRPAKLRPSGFSLVELSIVVAILSVVAALGLEAAANFVNRTSTSVSRERLQVVDEAVAKFFKVYGRLPCPETKTIAPGATNFGLENCTVSGGAANPIPLLVGTGTGNGLLAGALPWRTLNIPMMYSLDGFGSKFNYVVTVNLTAAGGGAGVYNRFGSTGGTAVQNGLAGIEVRTGVLEQPCSTTKCQVVANPATSTGAAYFIFSSGADQRGAVSARGVALAGCTTGTNNTDRRVDGNNCVFGATGVRDDLNVNGVASTIPYNVFYDNRYNPGLNLVSYYDDVAVWRTRAQL